MAYFNGEGGKYVLAKWKEAFMIDKFSIINWNIYANDRE